MKEIKTARQSEGNSQTATLRIQERETDDDSIRNFHLPVQSCLRAACTSCRRKSESESDRGGRCGQCRADGVDGVDAASQKVLNSRSPPIFGLEPRCVQREESGSPQHGTVIAIHPSPFALHPSPDSHGSSLQHVLLLWHVQSPRRLCRAVPLFRSVRVGVLLVRSWKLIPETHKQKSREKSSSGQELSSVHPPRRGAYVQFPYAVCHTYCSMEHRGRSTTL